MKLRWWLAWPRCVGEGVQVRTDWRPSLLPTLRTRCDHTNSAIEPGGEQLFQRA